MKLRTVVVTVSLGAGVLGGAVAVSSPAWAACSNSAFEVTTSMVAKGTRDGCAGSNVDFEVRLAEDLPFLPDPVVANKWTTFQNGTLSVTGDCRLRNGEYYTWVLVNGSSNVESPRRNRC